MRVHSILLLVLLTLLQTSFALAQAPSMSGAIFYFHLKSEIYRTENASAIVLEEANLAAPTSSDSRDLLVAAAIPNSTFIGTIWIGSIAWVTEALNASANIQGTVAFTVWLSSDDVTPTLSGVGAGLAVLNSQNQTIGNYMYTFTYAHGNVLTSTPTAYTFNLDVNRSLLPGYRLVFAVGVGSTTEGWHMNVFFDGVQYQSRAQLPETITVLPEFDGLGIVLMLLISVSFTCGLRRRRARSSKIA